VRASSRHVMLARALQLYMTLRRPNASSVVLRAAATGSNLNPRLKLERALSKRRGLSPRRQSNRIGDRAAKRPRVNGAATIHT
jgi:hypothetical protein